MFGGYHASHLGRLLLSEAQPLLSWHREGAAEPGHRDQGGPVTAALSKMRQRRFQGDAELMAKEQALGFEPARPLGEVEGDSFLLAPPRSAHSR